jgi:hypothetical protein
MLLFLDFLQVKNLGLSKEFVLHFFRDHNETPKIYAGAHARAHAHARTHTHASHKRTHTQIYLKCQIKFKHF